MFDLGAFELYVQRSKRLIVSTIGLILIRAIVNVRVSVCLAITVTTWLGGLHTELSPTDGVTEGRSDRVDSAVLGDISVKLVREVILPVVRVKGIDVEGLVDIVVNAKLKVRLGIFGQEVPVEVDVDLWADGEIHVH